MHQKIFIIGLPGVGKTTLGKELATQLGLPFVDLDSYIEKIQDQTIPAIFNEGGESAFRNIEAHALKSFSQLNNSFVMACGGGTPCYNSNMDFMNRNGITIYYTKPIANIIIQLQNDATERPLLKNSTPADLLSNLNKLLTKREPYYLKANIISDGLLSTINALRRLVQQAQ
jgi:shikimate kinase